MIFAALLARWAPRPSSATLLQGHPAAEPPPGPLRWFRFVTPSILDFDMSGVVLDAVEIDDDLAEAFARGPYAAPTRPAPPSAASALV